MLFIDWDGNGQIDSTNIAISIALDEGDEIEEKHSMSGTKKSCHGCLLSI